MASISFDYNGVSTDDHHLECSKAVCDISEVPVSFPQIPSDNWDGFGEPRMRPGIGDQHQVQIPLPVKVTDFICYSRNHSFVGNRNYSDHYDLDLLPIPLKWTGPMRKDVKRITERHNCSNEENLRIPGKYLDEEMDKFSDEHCFIVPGLSSENWHETEKASFVLGLYIFEKNFVELRRFVETKEMGSILSFYYGEFYGSDKYRKWSESRKTKGRKCVFGRKIFLGSRQQELLSRVLPGVPEGCQNDLLEVSRRFVEDKMTLADYVTSLKVMVGMDPLVEAVGIGKGKQDLTRMALEPSRSNQAVTLRPEMPTGKACSSLTTAEIVKFLNGDYRLSKARSNDLFWEAIWPRLLARGWHSEQPRNHGYAKGSKHCLVFLVPGVTKYSRKLVKGDHYFDSVTDVLSKVAKDPVLIELDLEDGDNKSREEYKCTIEESDEEEDDDDKDLHKSHRSCYLQPRIHDSDSIKFTVVDTSLFHGKIRELRSIPPEISNELASNGVTEEVNEDICDETDTINTMLLNASAANKVTAKTKSGGKMLAGKRERDRRSLYQDGGDVYSDISLISLKKKKVVPEKKEQKKVVKFLFSRKVRQENDDYEASIAKRCRKSTIRDNAISSSTSLVNGTANCCSDSCSVVNNRMQEMIDLNLPQVYPDFENGTLPSELGEEKGPKTDIKVMSEKQSVLNSRRHGTRNRPPTTKVLEAVANGYLTVTRKRKIKDHEGIPSRHLYHSVDLLGPCDIPPLIENAENSEFNSGNGNMLEIQSVTESK